MSQTKEFLEKNDLSIETSIIQEKMIPVRNGDVRVLIYQPDKKSELLPIFFDIHGGGFVHGKPEDDEFFCQRVCKELGIVD